MLLLFGRESGLIIPDRNGLLATPEKMIETAKFLQTLDWSTAPAALTIGYGERPKKELLDSLELLIDCYLMERPKLA